MNEAILARIESWLRAADHNLSADNATGWSRAYFTGCRETLEDVRALLTGDRELL